MSWGWGFDKSQLEQKGIKQGISVTSRAKMDITRSNGFKDGQRRPNGSKRAQTVPAVPNSLKRSKTFETGPKSSKGGSNGFSRSKRFQTGPNGATSGKIGSNRKLPH